MPTLLCLLLSAAVAGPILTPPDEDEEDELLPDDDLGAPVPVQDLDLDLDLDPPEPPPRTLETPAADVPLRYEVSLRGRYVSVPRGLMDAWFTDAGDAGWPVTSDRPFVQAATYGVDLAVYDRKSSLILVYVDLLHTLMDEGYWDDRDDGAQTFGDGRWIRPSPFFGAVLIGVNGLYDAPIVQLSQTKDRFALSFQVGGGLGIAAMVGRLDAWEVDRTTGTPAYAMLDQEPTRFDLKSPVWPVPDLTLGLKFNFVDRVVLRLEGGVHGGFFYGAALGGRL